MPVAAPLPISASLSAACTARLARVRDRFAQHGVNALLIGCETDIRYLTSFVGHDSYLLVTESDAFIVSDSRYDEFLEPWRAASFAQVVMGIRHRLPDTLADLCGRKSVRTLGIQAEHLSVATRASLTTKLPGIKLIDTTGLLSGLRMIKDDLEVKTIERAIAIQQEALSAALSQVRLGMTELELSGLLDFEMKRRGAFTDSFDAIIGAGRYSSVPHHATGPNRIEPGVLLIDWGASLDGYCGDLTRTFSVGEMSPLFQELYDIVLRAQLAAIEFAKPGVVCAAVDRVARDVITAAGYGEHFAHGLGHGLGMDVHEPPFFNNLQTDITLKPGMVMTFEPGIYLPGVGGIRIEDDVLITPTGTRVLSSFPKTLQSAVIEPAG
jgi:Xaa-Pro aminopeptidase